MYNVTKNAFAVALDGNAEMNFGGPHMPGATTMNPLDSQMGFAGAGPATDYDYIKLYSYGHKSTI